MTRVSLADSSRIRDSVPRGKSATIGGAKRSPTATKNYLGTNRRGRGLETSAPAGSSGSVPGVRGGERSLKERRGRAVGRLPQCRQLGTRYHKRGNPVARDAPMIEKALPRSGLPDTASSLGL
jgi:hypothetical protein